MLTMIWRFFPGPAWLRIAVMLVALALLVYLLITVVYPWVTTMLPQPPSTIEGAATYPAQ